MDTEINDENLSTHDVQAENIPTAGKVTSPWRLAGFRAQNQVSSSSFPWGLLRPLIQF